MKKALLIAAAILAVSSVSVRAEQQVYSQYPQAVAQPQPGYSYGESRTEMLYQQLHHNRVYPGREGYGSQFGDIPQHPGDYRDAVDRGQWSAGTAMNGRTIRVE